MNFRSENHFLEFFSKLTEGTPSGRSTHGALAECSGRVFRGDSRAAGGFNRVVSWLGHVAHPEASGKLSLAGVAVQPGLPGTRGALARHPGRWSRARHSGQVSHSEGWSGRGGFGRGFERRHSARVRVGSGRVYHSGLGTRVIFRKGSGRWGASG